MKILFAGYALEKASGVTTFVERTAIELRNLGHEVEIVDIVKSAITSCDISKYDIVHLHCLWQLHAYAKAAFSANVPVVWSTHGMTAPWSMHHKWLKKAIAWHLFQRRDLKRASAIHCTTNQEVEWNRRFGLKNCFVAPLGTDVPEGVAASETSRPIAESRTLLFVGRIYPVKGLENLIRAWKLALDGGMSGWRLRIVGPDEAGHLAQLRALTAALGLGEIVQFPGPVFGEALKTEYSSCDCLVLPSFTENFGATVVDAMAHAKPVIASRFTPWKELEEHKCGWWVDNKPDVLAGAIRAMAALAPEERAAMGARGRALAAAKYSWPAVAAALERKYKELVRR